MDCTTPSTSSAARPLSSPIRTSRVAPGAGAPAFLTYSRRTTPTHGTHHRIPEASLRTHEVRPVARRGERDDYWSRAGGPAPGQRDRRTRGGGRAREHEA